MYPGSISVLDAQGTRMVQPDPQPKSMTSYRRAVSSP